MYVLIDGQALQTPGSRHRGIGRYAGNLIAGLAAARPAWRFEVVENAALPPIARDTVGNCGLCRFRPPLPFDLEDRDANERYFGDWISARAPDVVLEPSFFEYHAVVPQFTGTGPPLFGVLYDLIPLLFQGAYLAAPQARSSYARRLRQALTADCLLAISQASANDFNRLIPGPRPEVVAIGGAPDWALIPYPEDELACRREALRQSFGLEREYILYVGGGDWRKNLGGALESYSALPPEVRGGLDLVVACELQPDQRLQLEQRARALEIQGSVKLTGYVSDQDLVALYQFCRVFFFPSLYEGLGLPVVEALRCGAPIVAADRSAVVEVAGSVAWLADPETPAKLAAALTHALAEPRELRHAERVDWARKFRWELTADLACNAMQGGRRRRAAQKPSIAWCAPLPKDPGGEDGGTAALMKRLTQDFDIDLVVDHRQPPVLPLNLRRQAVVYVSEVLSRQQTQPYDLLVYELSNSPRHRYALPLFARHGGLVVLRDSNGDPWVNPEAAPLEDSPSGARRGDGGLLEWIMERAHGLIVTSLSARERLRGAVTAPVSFIPLPSSTPARSRQEAGGWAVPQDQVALVGREYRRVIDEMIATRAAADTLWVELAAEGLRRCPDRVAAEAVAAEWAALRARGRRALWGPVGSALPAGRKAA
jgi:glycosyltransferase involved in cell wall biosynthesis